MHTQMLDESCPNNPDSYQSMLNMCVIIISLYENLGRISEGSEEQEMAVRFPGRATIPLDGNLGQVVYSHCLPSFSAPRN